MQVLFGLRSSHFIEATWELFDESWGGEKELPILINSSKTWKFEGLVWSLSKQENSEATKYWKRTNAQSCKTYNM